MSKEKTKVSVIIPTFNRSNLISRAIKSVLNQTFKDFELIVVDDGSTDNTEELVQSFHDTRIIYIKQKNQGPASARNTGILKSRGEYIAFLDSDDEWVPSKLKNQIKLFQNSRMKNLGFVGGKTLGINLQGKFVKITKAYQKGCILKECLNRELKPPFINSNTAMIRKSVLNEVGHFDENLIYNEDTDLWIRIAKKYNFDMVNEVISKTYKGYKINRITIKIAQNKEYLLKKHRITYSLYPKIYAKQLSLLASQYFIRRNILKGRRYCLESIKLSPSSLISHLKLFFSYLGVLSYLLAKNYQRVKNFRISRKDIYPFFTR